LTRTVRPPTEEQLRAIRHDRGAACVVAGAGTGKTHTLCERIVHLIGDRGLDPKRILVTTFTRKATAELYQRTFERLGDRARSVKISTIDALIFDLAQEASNRGFMPHRQLLGEAESRVLLLEAAWETIGSGHSCGRTHWSGDAEKIGLVGVLEDALRLHHAPPAEQKALRRAIAAKFRAKRQSPYLGFCKIPTPLELNTVVRRYVRKLDARGAADYGGLAAQVLGLLQRRRRFAAHVASLFDSILVDEFQDTSRVQAEILLLVAAEARDVWVVGDPCQQIYEWRGAAPANLQAFVKRTRAARYHLTENWRSTQAILDSAHSFLRQRVPSLHESGMLKRLLSRAERAQLHPVYSADLDRALWFVRRLLDANAGMVPADVALLSRKLDRTTVKQIQERAAHHGLLVQFHSSRADRMLERTIGTAPPWRPGTALDRLYKDARVRDVLTKCLSEKDFSPLRELRPLATAAEATDRALPPTSLTFREAWPALKMTQDREIGVSAAVRSREDAVQVMTIHAAKGLEFPIVLMMKLGGSKASFPRRGADEDARLAYVGATRARDVLILVHTSDRPKDVLAEFGGATVPIWRRRHERQAQTLSVPAILESPPIVAATDLDIYEQCPLKFAAFHEGRYLPKWSVAQSMGSRMHKALEYLLRDGGAARRPELDACFKAGVRDGDSPNRTIPASSVQRMRRAFRAAAADMRKERLEAVLIEHRYRYTSGPAGQVDGVIDVLLRRPDGALVLREWKTSSSIPGQKRRQYELQARAGALGIAAQEGYRIDAVEVVPVLHPADTLALHVDGAFVETSQDMLDRVFRDMRDNSYEPTKGPHCKACPLKPHCPAWR